MSTRTGRWPLTHLLLAAILAATGLLGAPIAAGKPGPGALWPIPARAASAPSGIPALDAGWLDWLNYYRALAGLAPAWEDPALSTRAQIHANYVARWRLPEEGQCPPPDPGTHCEFASNPHYSAEGHQAAQNSDLAYDLTSNTQGEWISEWMAAPYHAQTLLYPISHPFGFGSAFAPGSGSPTPSAAVLYASELRPGAWSRSPVIWPGPEARVPINSFSRKGENPSPIDLTPDCREADIKADRAGLPLIWIFRNPPSIGAWSLKTGDGRSLAACISHEGNSTTPADRNQNPHRFAGTSSVFMIPRDHLPVGTYVASLEADGTVTSTRFSVVHPPAAPTRVTASNHAPGGLRITWQPPENEGGLPLTGYEIWFGSDLATARSTATGASVTALDLVGLQPGRLYRVWVRPVNAAGRRSIDDPASAGDARGIPLETPSTPVIASVRGFCAVTVAWSAGPHHFGAADPTAYILSARPLPGGRPVSVRTEARSARLWLRPGSGYRLLLTPLSPVGPGAPAQRQILTSGLPEPLCGLAEWVRLRPPEL